MRVFCAGIAAVALACAAEAGDGPAFEVASIKPAALDTAKIQSQSAAGIRPKMGKQISGTRVEYNYMSLAELIAEAYHVNFNRVGGPDWIRSIRYDIAARMPEGGTEDGSRLMLQSLLEQRFRLAIRRESIEQPVLALVVGTGGSKLKEATAGAADQKPSYQYDSTGTVLRLTAPSMTMADLAEMLSGFSKLGGADGRFIVDRTGLAGKYQVALDIPLAHLRQMAQATRNDLPADGGASEPEGPSLFESVQSLGLRLERQKAPVEQLIVERAEKAPTEN